MNNDKERYMTKINEGEYKLNTHKHSMIIILTKNCIMMRATNKMEIEGNVDMN